MTEDELVEALLVEAARQDVSAFAELVMVDEQTGKPVKLASHHRRMFANLLSHAKTVHFAPSEFGKSACMAAFIAWCVGRDPSKRIGLFSATLAIATRLLRLVAIVMHSPMYGRVFPGIAVDRSTADELAVTGRPATMKDMNVVAGTYDLTSIQGVRLDMAMCDDSVRRESIRTAQSRDADYQAFVAVTMSRLAPGGAIHVVNTAEHSDDIPHRLAKLPGWYSASFPALDEQGNPTWPERWSAERIEARRHELGPIGFRRAMMCEPIDAAALVFAGEDLQRALQLGLSPYLNPAGGRVVIGVDPAWTTTATADESGIVMVTIDSEGFRHVVHVEALRVHHDRLVDHVVELARVNRATVYCESNGAGGVMADAIGKRVPCKPLPTTRTSKQARVEALSAELASGRWVFRQPIGSPGPELRKLVDELTAFSFESHCGDRASALLVACEGARALEARPKMRWHTLDLHLR